MIDIILGVGALLVGAIAVLFNQRNSARKNAESAERNAESAERNAESIKKGAEKSESVRKAQQTARESTVKLQEQRNERPKDNRPDGTMRRR